MRKKVFAKRLILKKETVSHLTTDEMNDARGGDSLITTPIGTTNSMLLSCRYYFTECMLTYCERPA